MPTQKKKKNTFKQVDTSRCHHKNAYSKPNYIDVEGNINKNKEVREKDVFNFNHNKKDNNVRK